MLVLEFELFCRPFNERYCLSACISKCCFHLNKRCKSLNRAANISLTGKSVFYANRNFCLLVVMECEYETKLNAGCLRIRALRLCLIGSQEAKELCERSACIIHPLFER